MAAQDPSSKPDCLLEDYELHLAQRMVPEWICGSICHAVPLEACGTSGMKAALNGAPQLSHPRRVVAEG